MMCEKTSKVSTVFSRILDRLPSTYPQATLEIHQSLKALETKYYKMHGTALDPGDPGHPPFAFCGRDKSIHVAYVMNKEDVCQISWYILHEMGHLLALQKYGENDLRWDDYTVAERYANLFADRWCKKLKEEGFF